MLFVTVKRIVEGLCFVEKINRGIDGFYDDFLEGAICLTDSGGRSFREPCVDCNEVVFDGMPPY